VVWASAVTSLGALAVAALSLYLAYRGRLSPYREKIYDRQLDAASEVAQALGKLHDQIQGIVSTGGIEGPESNLQVMTTDARTEFFKAYRRWNVILTKPVTDAIADYVQSLAEVSDQLYSRPGAENLKAGEVTSRLAESYSHVLRAARQSIHVEELTSDTVRLIESQDRNLEPEDLTDPLLYFKVVAERPVFKNFADESSQDTSVTKSAPKQAAEILRDQRNRLYVEDRNLFLIHTWRPSARKGQVADISIRLTEHVRRGPEAGQASTERPLADGLVEKVEYDLGSSFRTFEKHNAEARFRLDISAYGPTLCLAKVYFTDNHPAITLYRYLDFIMDSPWNPTVSAPGAQDTTK
jgi:hypothetical protein